MGGFEGIRCEINADDCNGNRCQNNANAPMDILANFAKPKFPIAPLLNLAHAKMAENVLIILHITLANVNLDLLAKIARQISMIAWIICARMVPLAWTESTNILANAPP